MKKIDDNIKEIIKKQRKVTLGFSTGKDSLCCALILKNLDVEYTPFFFYHVPDLDFVNENIRIYEKKLNINIIQMPHPMLYDYLRHQDFQTEKMANHIGNVFQKTTFEELIDLYNYSIDEDEIFHDIVGMRACESFNRRMYFKKNGAIDEINKKIYPIHNWNMTDVNDYIIENKVPFSSDYNIWNRSFDGLKYQFLIGVKNNYPKDWIKINEYFPLIELEIFRYENNIKYFENEK